MRTSVLACFHYALKKQSTSCAKKELPYRKNKNLRNRELCYGFMFTLALKSNKIPGFFKASKTGYTERKKCQFIGGIAHDKDILCFEELNYRYNQQLML